MIEYKNAYAEVKYIEVLFAPKMEDQKENFCWVTVFVPGEEGYTHSMPGLLKFEHGNNNLEEWQVEWKLLSSNREDAIREAQATLDNYELGQPVNV